MTITGVVKEIKGDVKVIAADGSERSLEKGDIVYGDELISTGLTGSLSIEFPDGTHHEIGRESQITLNNESLNSSADVKTQGNNEEAITEMLKAILNGDSIEELPPTAAGNTPDATAQGSDDGSGFVDVVKADSRGTPNNGFKTTGVTVVVGGSIAELILNPEIEPTFASEPVSVPVDLVGDDNVIHNQYSFGNIPFFNNNQQLSFSPVTSDSGAQIIEVRISIFSLLNNDDSSLELVSVSNAQNGTVRIGTGEDEGFVVFTHERQEEVSGEDLVGFFEYAVTNGAQIDTAVVKVTFDDISDAEADDIISSALLAENVGTGQTLSGTEGEDVIISGENGDKLIGNEGNDVLIGNGGRDYIEGDGREGAYRQIAALEENISKPVITGGDDVLIGGESGGDFLVGDFGFVYHLGRGEATVIGGDDTLTAGGASINSGAENVISSTLVGDVAYANGIGSGVVSIVGGNDTLHGSNVDDDIYGDVDQAVGNSVVFGGNDRLNGNDGDDSLYGGGGDDLLMGGADADDFIWRSGDDEDVLTTNPDGVATDTILDFNEAEGDTIEIGDMLEGTGSGADLIDLGYLEYEVIGGSTHISIDVNGSGGGDAFNATQEIVLEGAVFAPSEGQTFSLNGNTLIIDTVPVASDF